MLGCFIIKYILESRDRKLMKARDNKKFRHKGYKNNCIKTIMGEVEYKRAVYLFEEDGEKKYVYLLDEEQTKYLMNMYVMVEWQVHIYKDLNIPNIEIVTQASEIIDKNLNDYCAIFIGGGNTFKLLDDLKTSSAFKRIQDFINNNGIVFGGSAGAIIFGKNLKSCALDGT